MRKKKSKDNSFFIQAENKFQPKPRCFFQSFSKKVAKFNLKV